MVKELIPTYADALKGAHRDLERETRETRERRLQAALIILAGEGDEAPLRELAEDETQEEPQLEIARYGACALLGREPEDWDPVKLEGRVGMYPEQVTTVRLAVALIRGEAQAIEDARLARQQVPPTGGNGTRGPLEALRFSEFVASEVSRRTLRVDVADQCAMWLPADEAIVIPAVALLASGRDPEGALELIKNSFWDLSTALRPDGQESGMRLKSEDPIGDEIYSAKERSLLYTKLTTATELSECSYWPTWHGFTRTERLVEDILEGDIVLKDLKGARTTKKKLVESLADEEFTVGIRIPDAENVLTAGAIQAIDQRFAALESWMHTAYKDKVRCQFRFVRE